MKENENAVIYLINQMIDNNQLSDDEQIEIKNLIEEKQKEKKYKQKGRCLAEVIEPQMNKKLEEGFAEIEKNYRWVFIKCFQETTIGNLDCLKLSEKIIRIFVSDVRNSFGLNDTEMNYFISMLRNGLNKMADNGDLDFTPDNSLYDASADPEQGIVYIDNPYTPEETEKIVQWAAEHPADVRGIAINLWFAKGISLTEIVHLTKKDCWRGERAEDSIMKFDKNLFRGSIRSKILWKSLCLHPKTINEVFVIPNKDKSGWEKLTEGGLQRKLWYICKDVGIAYKKIEPNEAIKI